MNNASTDNSNDFYKSQRVGHKLRFDQSQILAVDSPIKKTRISPRLENSLMASSIQSVNSNGGLSFINELKRLQNTEELKFRNNGNNYYT